PGSEQGRVIVGTEALQSGAWAGLAFFSGDDLGLYGGPPEPLQLSRVLHLAMAARALQAERRARGLRVALGQRVMLGEVPLARPFGEGDHRLGEAGAARRLRQFRLRG